MTHNIQTPARADGDALARPGARLSDTDPNSSTPLAILAAIFNELSPSLHKDKVSILLHNERYILKYNRLTMDPAFILISEQYRKQTGARLKTEDYKEAARLLLVRLDVEERHRRRALDEHISARIRQDEPDEPRKIPAFTRKLLTAIAAMPDKQGRERQELLERRFIWTDDGIYKLSGNELTSRVNDLWLTRFEMRQIVNIWEPSERVDGLLSMEDRRYLARVSKGEQSQELTISRKDATRSLKPDWPSQLHVVAQPDEKMWSKLAQFFDEVATTCELPALNHYSSAGLLKAPSSSYLQFVTPNGGAITVNGRDENGLVMFPVQYESALARQPYQFFDGSEQDAAPDFRIWMKARGVAPGAPGAETALLGVFGLAPLAQLITPPNLLVDGRSQSKKSTLVRLNMQACTSIYGHEKEWCTFNLRDTPPTDYYIEQCSYFLAGLPLFFDDGLKGKASPKQIESFYQLWSRFLGYVLNDAGKGRGKPGRSGDGGVAKNWRPRSPMIATVEVLPRPQDQASTLARCAVVTLDGPDCLNMALLNELQSEESARAMNRAYTRYIRWLLGHVTRASELVKSFQEQWTSGNLASSNRLQDIYARLEAGGALIYEYGHEIGALSESEQDTYASESRQELLDMARAQSDLLNISDGTAQEFNPIVQFKRCLESALRAQKICLTDAQKDVVGNNKVARPPQELPEDLDELKLGWTYNTNQNAFERKSAMIAGALHKRGIGGGSYPWTLKIRSTEWEKVYAYIEKAAEVDGLAIPGAKAMLGILADAGLAKKSQPEKGARYHLLNMTWYIEDDPNAPDTEPDEPAPDKSDAPDEQYSMIEARALALDTPLRQLIPAPVPPARQDTEQDTRQDEPLTPASPGQDPPPGRQDAPAHTWVTIYADIRAGRALTEQGKTFTFTPDCSLSQFLAAAHAVTEQVNRVFLCGARPGGDETAEAFINWLADPDMLELYTTDKRGHFLDTLKPDACVARYAHRASKKRIDVRRIVTWLGDDRDEQDAPLYSIEDARAALALVTRYLRQDFTFFKHVSGTPSTTFKGLWTEGNRIAGKKFTPLPDEIRGLIHTNAGQGRIEFYSEHSQGKIPGLYYYDGIFMYAALTWGMPTELATHDNKNEYAGKVPARYRIRYTVPASWQYVGLFMTKREPDGWFYPGAESAGMTFETWADGAELDVAYNLPPDMPAWDITILERMIFKPEKESTESKPLETITSKLVRIREQIDTDKHQDAARIRVYTLARGAIRNILLHGIGSFNRTQKTRSYILLATEPAPAGYITYDELDERRRLYTVAEESADESMLFPQWPALIWARCRARMTRAALSRPYGEIIAIRTDAIAVTRPVSAWEANKDATKAGLIRRKWAIEKPLSAPATAEKLDELQRKIKK